MSKEKALEFLKFMENRDIQEKMSGFTPDELAEAVKEKYGELSDEELGSAAGGRGRVPFSSPGWIKYFIEQGKKKAQNKQ